MAESGSYEEFLQLGLSAVAELACCAVPCRAVPCRQQAACSALLPPAYAISCSCSGLREQGNLETTGMMLKGEEAWPET